MFIQWRKIIFKLCEKNKDTMLLFLDGTMFSFFHFVLKSIWRFANTISTKHRWKVFTEKEMHTLTHALSHAHMRSDTLVHTSSSLSLSLSLSQLVFFYTHMRSNAHAQARTCAPTHAQARTMLLSSIVNTYPYI